jgi:predicted HicB family RNase H-like nuclease
MGIVNEFLSSRKAPYNMKITKKTMEHKNYKGSIEWCPKEHMYFGKIINTKDHVLYDSKSLKGLRRSFIRAVNDYIKISKKIESGRL